MERLQQVKHTVTNFMQFTDHVYLTQKVRYVELYEVVYFVHISPIFSH